VLLLVATKACISGPLPKKAQKKPGRIQGGQNTVLRKGKTRVQKFSRVSFAPFWAEGVICASHLDHWSEQPDWLNNPAHWVETGTGVV
jgi:hypothetical protein